MPITEYDTDTHDRDHWADMDEAEELVVRLESLFEAEHKRLCETDTGAAEVLERCAQDSGYDHDQIRRMADAMVAYRTYEAHRSRPNFHDLVRSSIELVTWYVETPARAMAYAHARRKVRQPPPVEVDDAADDDIIGTADGLEIGPPGPVARGCWGG